MERSRVPYADSSFLSKRLQAAQKQAHFPAETRPKTNELLMRFSMYKDPASNLKTLLYGTQSPEGLQREREEDPVSGFDPELDSGFFAVLDKTLEGAGAHNAYPLEILLRKQDAYIEQLEKEKNMLKIEFGHISSKVHEVIAENQHLIQERKSDLLNSILLDASNRANVAGPKGLSDEEKMSHGIMVGNARPSAQSYMSHFENIQQLEVELGRARLELQAKNKEIEELKSTSTANEQTRAMFQLKTDNEELVTIVMRLEESINKMKSREEDAQQQIKQNISLVEQVQFEKVEALLERDKANEDLQKQQRRIEDLIKEYEVKVESERERISEFHKNKLEEVEHALVNATSDQAKTRLNLEKVNREKLDLQHQLQKAQNQLDIFHGDMQQMAEKLQEEITKALMERNIALQDLTQVKLNWEREKQEHQREMNWMKSELVENRKRLDEVERCRMKAKSELVRLTERNLSLEKEAKWSMMMADQEKQGRKVHMDRILNRVQLKEEELFETMRDVESKHVQQHIELERMIEMQITLVDRFKNECRHLSNRMENMLINHQVSKDDLKRSNDILLEKLSSTSDKYNDLENLCSEHNRRQVEMKQKLQQMEREVSTQNKKIVDLLGRQNFLLKERQFLHGEMAFLYEKFNSEVK